MTTSNLVVPMVVWGHSPPTHCIGSILITPNQKNIVTGCNDGQICVWSIDDDWKIRPQCMYFGHTAAVTILALGSTNPDRPYIVSSSDNGEMCLWDLADGRCMEHTKLPFTHTSVQAYQMMLCRDVRLVCNGYYPEIHIMHPWSLEVLYSLSSRLHPDWISSLCILRPVKREDDVVVAITNSGTVKVWTLTGNESKSQPIYEDEAKQIRCLNAETLKCCPYNQRTVLIVCSKYWQIYDAGDFTLLCSESCRRGSRWVGGDWIGMDRIVVWCNLGKSYLFKLPVNTNPEMDQYRGMPQSSSPQAYTVLDVYIEKALLCCPKMYYFHGRRDKEVKVIVRGDCEGRLVIWEVPDVNENKMKLVRQESFDRLPVIQPKTSSSLRMAWHEASITPEGLMDQVNSMDGKMLEISSSIYIPSQGRLVAGRQDGTIVIVPVIYAMKVLNMETDMIKENIPHQTLIGHKGRVNCLLYPHNSSSRYDPNHLVSGGMDFTVVLWDLASGTQLHTFSVHGGEVTQLMAPPANCNPRVLPCVCSVASDHSLALLSLKERKSILLASRQLFPIQTVKWRPLDDFLVISCVDGTVYVWQMETGHLDRVVNGAAAEDILDACDAKVSVTTDVINPTISLAQAFKRHNLATFRNFAQQKIKDAANAMSNQNDGITPHASLLRRSDIHPMYVQGLKTNIKDADAHVCFFDTEAMIIELLGEEYALMSPGTLQAFGLLPTASPEEEDNIDAGKKIAAFMARVKDKAEDLQNKIETGFKPLSPMFNNKEGADGKAANRPKHIEVSSKSLTMEVCQYFISCLHAWTQDKDLDRLCLSKLGLLKPKVPMSFGLISRGGHMSLPLPGWHERYSMDYREVSSLTRVHWQLSGALTTHHLLSVISITNTLMTMSNATFLDGKRSIVRKQYNLQGQVHASDAAADEMDDSEQSQTKQGWSLLAAMHCVLLPDLLGETYKPPQLEMLARRWQDRCLEIREAAQALLLAELRRIGAEGRKRVVDDWSPFLPGYIDPSSESQNVQPATGDLDEEPSLEDDDQILEESTLTSQLPDYHLTKSFENRRKQATAIVMMGVLGAEFGQGLEPERKSADSRQRNIVEGFGLNHSHARHTSKALTYLLLQPASNKLPAYSPIRQAAIDLLGRGFTVWEPYLDVSSVLLGLLELCIDGDKLVPRNPDQKEFTRGLTFGLPLTPQADTCRTARHTLSLIATARPPAFITTMAKEVARYNAMAQNAQTPSAMLNNAVLVRAKSEILRVLELLVDKIPNDIVDLLVEVVDVTVHCLDLQAVKTRGLQEVFPALCRFSMVSYCHNTRRIGVGAKSGSVAFYELKHSKSQILPSHKGPVIAVSFSPDGKYLASFSHVDSKLCFWQTASTNLFGIGSQQTRCIKTYQAPPLKVNPTTNPLKIVRLIWIDGKTVVLLTVDGTETRFKV